MERPPGDLNKIRLHIKKPTEKNPTVAILAFWTDTGEWGIWRRTLTHKGINPDWLASRDMTEGERDLAAKQYRLFWWAYEQWDDLIKDEIHSVGDNTGWIDALHKASGTSTPIDKLREQVKMEQEQEAIADSKGQIKLF